MSANDNEELIDYEDEGDVGTTGAVASSGVAVVGATGDADGEKKNFSGIHSTGFRCAWDSCVRCGARC
jgi:ATP-dependent RNA helicase UAP56/SUB2